MTTRPLDDLEAFLDADGIREEVTLKALKAVIALRLLQAMKDQGMTKTALASAMGTSRAQLNRLLDDGDGNVTLATIVRAATILRLRFDLSIG